MKAIPFPCLVLLALSAFMCHPVQGQTKGFKSTHFNIRELAPGVWAAIHNDAGGHAICNAGIVDLGDRTVVFDPFMNIDAASDLKSAAESLTGRQVGIVVNSHFHNDHIRGNQLFDKAIIIGTKWTRDRIAITEPEELAWEVANAGRILEENRKALSTAAGFQKEEIGLWIAYFEGMVENSPKVRMTLPNQTFTDSLTLYGSERDIQLVEYRKGHTGSDVAMFIPRVGVVFAGDLLFNGRHAWIGDGDPEAWLSHLKGWTALPATTRYVPGHGEPGGTRVVSEMIQYISTLKSLVADKPMDTPESDISRIAIPDRYSLWKLRRFFPMNLSFLWGKRKADVGK